MNIILRSSLSTLIALLLILPTAICQTATPISGVINRYAAVMAIDTCSGRLAVSDTAGFRPGQAILLLQMQGAEISSANNFLYGIVQNQNQAGRYERSIVDSVTGGAVFLQKKLVNTYNLSGKLQAVTIPQYANATVTDTLKCQPWNGTTGGVLALDVSGTLTLNAPVSADGAGFRGGAAYIGPGNNCNFLLPETAFFYALGNWRGAYKGEGIALPIAGKELGRGPQASGGGGGNDHNSGGGGGANITDGGEGGDNDEPGALGCDGYYPGVRGYGAVFPAGRMFAGGGGGAGHSNNDLKSAGGSGGGIIVIRAGDLAGSVPVISANGRPAPVAPGDGAGGGGAGGTIWLQSGSAPAGLTVRANGGAGGNSGNNNSNRCFGPGGGGAGGRILTDLTGIASPTGGAAGVVTGSTNACNGTSNGATQGDNGLTETLPALPQGSQDYQIPQILAAPAADTVCPGNAAEFLVQTNPGAWTYQWQVNTGSGWQDIAGAPFTGFQSNTLFLPNAAAGQDGWRFRCRVARPGCFEQVSAEAALTLLAVPTGGFSAAVNGYTVDFSNLSSGDSYYWDFGDGQSSQVLNPQHTFGAEGTYTVRLYSITPCDTATTVQTVVILLPPTAGFNFPFSSAGCGSVLVDFTNASSANTTTFSWSFPGGTPAVSSQPNPSVFYTTTGIYPVTLIAANAAGQDTLQQLVVVTVNPIPIADFAFFVQPDGTVQFANQSLNAGNLLWNFGDNTTSTEPDPQHTYTSDGTYLVTLTVWNDCDTVSIQQTVAALFPPVAGFFVQDTTPGCQSATVEFGNMSSANATAYNWSFPGGSPAASSSPNPSVTYTASGLYTARLIVTNAVGADTLEQTFLVQVFGQPAADFNYTAFSGGVIQFANLSTDAQYCIWDFGDGYPQVPGFNILHQYAVSGTYTVTLFAISPCGVSILQQNIEVVVSGVATGEPQGLGTVRLYPNPVADWLTVDCTEAREAPVRVELWDEAGRLVFSDPGDALTRVSLAGLPAGMYRVVVVFGKGRLVRGVVRG